MYAVECTLFKTPRRRYIAIKCECQSTYQSRFSNFQVGDPDREDEANSFLNKIPLCHIFFSNLMPFFPQVQFSRIRAVLYICVCAGAHLGIAGPLTAIEPGPPRSQLPPPPRSHLHPPPLTPTPPPLTFRVSSLPASDKNK